MIYDISRYRKSLTCYEHLIFLFFCVIVVLQSQGLTLTLVASTIHSFTEGALTSPFPISYSWPFDDLVLKIISGRNDILLLDELELAVKEVLSLVRNKVALQINPPCQANGTILCDDHNDENRQLIESMSSESSLSCLYLDVECFKYIYTSVRIWLIASSSIVV